MDGIAGLLGGRSGIAASLPDAGTAGAGLPRAGAPALGVAVFVAVMFAPPLLGDGDTWWHLASGEWMLAHLAVPHADPFSYTAAGQPWTAHEWLSEVAMALSFRAAGWAGVAMLFGAAAGLAAGLMLRHLGRFLSAGPALLLVLLAASTVAPSLLARPHLLALPVMELWTAGLVIARAEGRAPPAGLAGLMVLWANLHGSFMAGLVLAVLLAVEAAVADRRALRPWAGFVALAALSALLTPNGVEGLLFPVALMGMKGAALVLEWQPVALGDAPPVLLIAACALYMGAVRGLRLPAMRCVIVAGLLQSGLAHGRNQMLCGVIGLLVAAEPLGRHLGGAGMAARREGTRGVAMAAVLACGVAAVLLRLAVPQARADLPSAPISALAHVPAWLRMQPVFNEYGMGGYLVFSGVRPFIDGRADLYGDRFVLRYGRIVSPDRPALVETLGRFGVAWTILDARSPVVAVMDGLAGWRRLYADGVAVVHIRTGGPAPDDGATVAGLP